MKKYLTVNFKTEDAGNRTLRFVGTDETIDRDHEILTAAGWDTKNYMKNPVFLWAHSHTSLPVGKTEKLFKRDGAWNFKVKFADAETYPFADTVYRMYKGGFLSAVSVGFIPERKLQEYDETTGIVTTTKKELLELSAVPVPCNPNALIQRNAKSAFDEGVIDEDQYSDFLKITKEYEVETEDTKTIFELKKRVEDLESKAKKDYNDNQDETVFDIILNRPVAPKPKTELEEKLSENVKRFKNIFEEQKK